MAGTLYVVSTPIGNLGDLTARAAELLRTVDAVLCEDTRHSRRLLDHVGSTVPALAYHEHNEARATPGLVARLVEGGTLAMVSDAGTPLLSDPGARLVRAALDAGVTVTPIPGASALLAALVASGVDATRFTFYGFLARKGRERREALGEVAALRHTAVLYEAPGRVDETLAELAAVCGGDRPAAVARELTKQFEEVRRGTLGELAAYYAGASVRGEVVLVVGGRSADADVADPALVQERVRSLHLAGTSSRDVARALVEEFGLPRTEAYRLAAEGRDDTTGSGDETE